MASGPTFDIFVDEEFLKQESSALPSGACRGNFRTQTPTRHHFETRKKSKKIVVHKAPTKT